ncbi:MAG: bifunctional 2',3'-cyclic-nucleotide 2'-phosphodiesterase/3'-nucleotidase [Gemmobacter sp.]
MADRIAAQGAALLDLRILATSDVHVQLVPHDYHADRPAPGLGLARTAVLIAEERAAAANVVLLDNGDFLQGNPMADYVAEVRGLSADAPHPAIAAMNALGYDAASLGNHEFNYGLPFLAAALAGARFPVVAANIAPLVPEAAVAAPYALLRREMVDRSGARWPLTIGVAGFVPPQIAAWDYAHLNGRITVSGIVETARWLVPQLRAAGADIVVALCHSGIGPDDEPALADPAAENAALALARIAGIDAVVAGHSHIVFPRPGDDPMPGADAARGRIGGKPAVMPGFAGSHLGVIDLVLRRAGGGWTVCAGTGRVRAAAELPPGVAAAPVIAAAARDHAATVAHLNRAVGQTAVPLHSHFALFEPSDAVRLIAEAQQAHVARLLAGGPHAGLPVLSAAAPFRSGGRGGPDSYTDVPPGPVTLRHLADLSPFPNTLCALRLTGRDIRRWLDHAAMAFRCVTPQAQDAPLLDPAWPGYNFDTILGLDYTIDLACPPGPGRVCGITMAGRPLDDDAPLILATNSYRAMGGGAFPGACPDAVVHAGTETIRDVLAAHLARIGRFSPAAPPAWRFAPMSGTTVLVEAGPGARRHLAGRPYTEVGETPEGFVQLRRTL